MANQRKALRVSVVDTGIGITSDARTRLFDSFARGRGQDNQNADRNHSSGVGLGLAIADRLVRLMGGEAAAHDGRRLGARAIAAASEW